MTDDTQRQEAQPPPISDFWAWLVFHLTRDWIMFLKYPVAAFAVVAITLFLCWLFVWQIVCQPGGLPEISRA